MEITKWDINDCSIPATPAVQPVGAAIRTPNACTGGTKQSVDVHVAAVVNVTLTVFRLTGSYHA